MSASVAVGSIKNHISDISECPRGRFGQGCEQTCSIHCAGPDGECDFTTGSCYQGCEPGFQPPTCHDGKVSSVVSGGSVLTD